MEDNAAESLPVPRVFKEEYPRYNQQGRIVTLGPYYPNRQSLDANGELRYIRETAATGYSAESVGELRRAVQWTRWINALNEGRKWPIKRLFERLDPQLSEGIAVVIVPAHDPFHTDPPIRALASQLAASAGRIDATNCLHRHTKIKRISWGGPSYWGLHRQTIEVRDTERFAGGTVLLLDDIARSGASLRACEGLLYEAGATLVQSVALGRVVSGSV